MDRCLTSNHHGSEFSGFAATGPAIGVSEKLWKWLACPRMRTDDYGRPWQAPYGLRKIEAALQDAGFRAYVIDPDYVAYYAKKAKTLLIGRNDYFAFGPPSSEWWLLTGREPVNRRSFIGLETGIETGSVRLACEIMPAEAAPYPAGKWPDIVEDAFSIMTDAGLLPAATFILGLPGETEEDVYQTIELLDRLGPIPASSANVLRPHWSPEGHGGVQAGEPSGTTT